MSLQIQKALVWFRRDLRDFDHAALYHALKQAANVYCVFVFDRHILDTLPNKADRRVEFIWESVRELKLALQQQGGDLLVAYDFAEQFIPQLAHTLQVDAVYSNCDYEPAAIARDAAVAAHLKAKKIAFHQYKDQVIFEQDEVLSQAGKPYGVFTPYRNAHIKKLNDFYVKPYPVDAYLHHYAVASDEIAQQYVLRELAQMGFTRTNLQSMKLPTGMSGGKALLEDFLERISYYEEARNFPAVKGPSYLSVHLRFGTVSIRYLARVAWQKGSAGATTWLNELIWRDFYFQILYHRPDLAEGKAYKAEYEALHFPNNPAHYLAWCEGKTGYPLVDAAMRQLNQTGYMHNRLRMVAGSFLVKDLLVDWRWGERYFAQHLIDFDFSANNGGWQWAASTGCDAQPYFRIFNPVSQSEKFDPQGKFIRKYVPEIAMCSDKEIHAPWTISSFRQQLIALEIGRDYPYPIVDHAVQRALALDLYKSAKI
ncbi:deoxyribodipyrimidine photo-lyase [Methylotenera sp. 1P/1]|uniref:cryptochrome/photolyase family protein n=1 Tax=Methylotenera sp. 1P/1 TaxID=1131551 RepID=UPI00036F74AF|nr:deoxyribodipyrimidine photo-lyase [Methylotenera sp. 1P/1]